MDGATLARKTSARLLRGSLAAAIACAGLAAPAVLRASPKQEQGSEQGKAAPARVERFVVEQRISPAFEGKAFGKAGAYELVIARMHASLDPHAAFNAGIVDLDKAPVNAAGRVEYSTQVTILKPVDPAKSSGTLVYEVINRSVGGIDTAGRELDRLGMFEALMNRGDVIVDAAWQGELSPQRMPPNFEQFRNQLGGASIYAQFPRAMEGAKPLVRRIRHQVEAAGANGAVKAALPYPAASGTSVSVFSRRFEADAPAPVAPDAVHLPDRDTVEIRPLPGAAVYDITYDATDAVVSGIGLAVPRELVSFLRGDAGDGSMRTNPLLGRDGRPLIRRSFAYGFSQSGRYLRMFLWQGFNRDAAGGKVFDGLVPVVAGGRFGFMNGLFADAGLIPGDVTGHRDAPMFPFAYPVLRDPIGGAIDGILKSCLRTRTCPKVIQIDSEFEAAGGWGWMMTTRADGRPIRRQPSGVRLYAVAGSDHASTGGAAAPAQCRAKVSSLATYRPVVRAALVNMADWIGKGTPPPPGRYPSLADGTLVSPGAARGVWPVVPGFPYRATSNAAEAFAPGEPLPVAKGRYPLLAPAIDADGNMVGGVRLPAVAVPTGTSTGLGGRKPGFAPEQDCPLRGEFLPFAPTRAERAASGDLRPSIEERYPGGAADILARRRAVARSLAQQRYILDADVEETSALAPAELK